MRISRIILVTAHAATAMFAANAGATVLNISFSGGGGGYSSSEMPYGLTPIYATVSGIFQIDLDNIKTDASGQTFSFIGQTASYSSANLSATAIGDILSLTLSGNPPTPSPTFVTDTLKMTINFVPGTLNSDFSHALDTGNILSMTYGASNSVSAARTSSISSSGTGTVSISTGPSPTLNFSRLTIQPSIAPVPEPATWAMMLAGFAGVGFAMRQRRSHNVTANYT
jgi:hypothetical protein